MSNNTTFSRQNQTPSETEKAWMAGFVDGEGCLTISCQIRKDRPTPSYRAFITVTNTKFDAMTIFVMYYGGQLREVVETRTSPDKVKWANAYTWYCPVVASKWLLNDILPFLRIKRPQAEILLDFINNKANTKRTHHINGRYAGSTALTGDELEKRAQWQAAIKALNAKSKKSAVRLETLKARQ